MASRDILFEVRGCAGFVTLNRPDALNAVTDAMLQALDNHLDEWERDQRVRHIVIKAGEGRAFSAGGDIRHLYDEGIQGRYDFDFFAREYALNNRIHNYPKPYVALIDGIVMGGGVGISFHGSHRVVGAKAVFAMPEVGIGFFPDVGGSRLLSRMPGCLGAYLGLTAHRLDQTGCLWSGLATHACPSQDLSALEEALAASPDPDAVLERFHKPCDEADIVADMDRINATFSAATLDEVFERLHEMAGAQHPDGEWARTTRQNLLEKSPTSLAVAWRQIREGADLDMAQCMRMEYRILHRILQGREFYEGVRAAIIDKDRQPKWHPATLEDVDLAAINAHFNPLGENELIL